MPYLMRMNVRPDTTALPAHELQALQRNFDIYAGEVFIYGEPVGWNEIDEVEIVPAPGAGGLFSKLFGMIEEQRYHIGLYLGREEAVLANVTIKQALYILQSVAYYAPSLVRYKGPEGLVPLTNR